MKRKLIVNSNIGILLINLIIVSVNCSNCDYDNHGLNLRNQNKSLEPGKSQLIPNGNSFKAEASIDRLKCLLSEQFNQPRHHLVDPVFKEETRRFLIDQMNKFTDELIIQTFDQPGEINIKGKNIIGVIAGTRRNQSDDNLILIGAHYDTYLTGINDITPGVNDNGSGLAVLLEVLRLLSSKIIDSTYRPLNSIMFVAFDFEEYGYTGSEFFVNDYLIPNELKGNKSSSFQGAIIMDTILNYNSTKGSQSFPSEAALITPETVNWIKTNDYKGDFLTLISRQTIESQLTPIFTKSWNNVNDKKSFKLLPVELPTTTELIGQFLRSDHANFWFHDFQSYKKQLPAIFLTDTGNFRGIMTQCYHRACDDQRLINDDNLVSLARVTDTLFSMVVSLSF